MSEPCSERGYRGLQERSGRTIATLVEHPGPVNGSAASRRALPPQARDDGLASSGVLLTGATGFVGMELLARYLEHTDRRVYALVRGADDGEVAARVQRTLALPVRR